MKNTIALFVAVWLAAAPLFSQNKAPSPLNPNPVPGPRGNPNSTRAVVVGISDYQENDIPDLRFAHRDAEAYANYLRSPAGGGLDNDHLQVLTNENATAGRVAEALDALVEQVKEGEQAIIYFSGHGDVERKTISQPGFLLCWDSPARIYMGGGTYSLAFLQDIVSTLSTQNKAKVLVITDACHAGKLAGSQIGGAQTTSANLAKQFANEVKILSCQPKEFSLEGEQWGGGRGVFSYHLLDGLYGLADKNGDGSVSVGEIDRFLEDNVTAEAAPQSQVPLLLGNKSERLATVDAAVLADLKKAKAAFGGPSLFTAIEGRGFEDEVLSKLDSGIVKKYFAFKKAVSDKRFFPISNHDEDAATTADELYASLSTEPGLAPLYGFLKRNYAAALQDDAQQVLNVWFKSSRFKTIDGRTQLPTKAFEEQIGAFARQLDRAAELLGSKHYLYSALKARSCFFAGYRLSYASFDHNPALGERILSRFRESLAWQPDQPHVYWQMGVVFHHQFNQPDSLEQYVRRALQLNPNWVMPCVYTAVMLASRFGDYERARPYLEMAVQIDSTSPETFQARGMVNVYCKKEDPQTGYFLEKAVALDSMDGDKWASLGRFYQNAGRYPEAETTLKKAVWLDSTNLFALAVLGNMYNQTGRFDEAAGFSKKAVSIDSTYTKIWTNLGFSHLKSGRYAEAEAALNQAIAIDSAFANPRSLLGMVFFKTQKTGAARQNFLKALSLDPNHAPARLGLASLLFSEGKTGDALGQVEEAILKKTTFEQLEKDEYLAPFRALPEWKDLMKKYFPDKVRD